MKSTRRSCIIKFKVFNATEPDEKYKIHKEHKTTKLPIVHINPTYSPSCILDKKPLLALENDLVDLVADSIMYVVNKRLANVAKIIQSL